MQMDMGHDNGPREICILVPRGPRQKKKKKKEEIIQDNDEGDDSSKLITVDDLQEAHQDFFLNLFKTYSYCTKARKERLYHVG